MTVAQSRPRPLAPRANRTGRSFRVAARDAGNAAGTAEAVRRTTGGRCPADCGRAAGVPTAVEEQPTFRRPPRQQSSRSPHSSSHRPQPCTQHGTDLAFPSCHRAEAEPTKPEFQTRRQRQLRRWRPQPPRPIKSKRRCTERTHDGPVSPSRRWTCIPPASRCASSAAASRTCPACPSSSGASG